MTTARKQCKGPVRKMLYLSFQNKALRGVSLVDVVLPVREGVPRFIHLRLESAAPLFPGIAALAFDPLPEKLVYWPGQQSSRLRAHLSSPSNGIQCYPGHYVADERDATGVGDDMDN
jgi:hypothetical protein